MIFILSINIANIFIPAGILVFISCFFAVLLMYLSKKLAIKRDERIDEVAKYLSGANCGGCGYGGCDAYAVALVKGEAQLASCPSTSKKSKQKIAQILDLSGLGEETVAVVNCHGGNDCKDKFEYQGYGNCNSCELLAGGRKQCPVGCMGLSTCAMACPYSAIKLNDDGIAEVVSDNCVSCGICIRECPKGLISRIPKSASVYIACSNDCKGKDVRGICMHGCIGCGICSKVCEAGAITMKNNLPQIDYSKCTSCQKCIEKCPVKCLRVRINT